MTRGTLESPCESRHNQARQLKMFATVKLLCITHLIIRCTLQLSMKVTSAHLDGSVTLDASGPSGRRITRAFFRREGSVCVCVGDDENEMGGTMTSPTQL